MHPLRILQQPVESSAAALPPIVAEWEETVLPMRGLRGEPKLVWWQIRRTLRPGTRSAVFTMTELIAMLGTSDSSVRRSLDALRAAGLIAVNRPLGPDGRTAKDGWLSIELRPPTAIRPAAAPGQLSPVVNQDPQQVLFDPAGPPYDTEGPGRSLGLAMHSSPGTLPPPDPSPDPVPCSQGTVLPPEPSPDPAPDNQGTLPPPDPSPDPVPCSQGTVLSAERSPDPPAALPPLSARATASDGDGDASEASAGPMPNESWAHWYIRAHGHSDEDSSRARLSKEQRRFAHLQAKLQRTKDKESLARGSGPCHEGRAGSATGTGDGSGGEVPLGSLLVDVARSFARTADKEAAKQAIEEQILAAVPDLGNRVLAGRFADLVAYCGMPQRDIDRVLVHIREMRRAGKLRPNTDGTPSLGGALFNRLSHLAGQRFCQECRDRQGRRCPLGINYLSYKRAAEPG